MTFQDQQTFDTWQYLARQFGAEIANMMLEASNDNEDDAAQLEVVGEAVSHE